MYGYITSLCSGPEIILELGSLICGKDGENGTELNQAA